VIRSLLCEGRRTFLEVRRREGEREEGRGWVGRRGRVVVGSGRVQVRIMDKKEEEEERGESRYSFSPTWLVALLYRQPLIDDAAEAD